MVEDESRTSPCRSREDQGAGVEERGYGTDRPHSFEEQEAEVGGVVHQQNSVAAAAHPPIEADAPHVPYGAAIFANPNNLFQYSLSGIDMMNPSVLHALQYHHMLNNTRMMQLSSQDRTWPRIVQENSVASAAASVNLQVGASVPIMLSSFFPILNLNVPIFPNATEIVNPNFPMQFPLFESPDPQLQQQEHDYDPYEEERKPYGQRCLLYLVEERHWVEALQRISTHPAEARHVGIQGRAPIHLACDNDAPAFLVYALLAVWPHGAFMVGTSYMNPLHITCSSQHASNEIVNLLLTGCGDPMRITGAKDVDGDTPLHAACRCAAPIDVLATLLQVNPGIVMWYDYEGLNPILRLWVRYYVLLGEAVISNIDSASDLTPELVEAWQKSLLLLRVMHEEDKKGSHNTRGEEDPSVFRVLHCASAVECPRCVLRIATILYPDQLTIPDEDGRLPLHIATKAPVYRVHDLGGEGYSIADAFDDFEVNRRRLENNAIEQAKKDEEFPDNPLNEPSVIDMLLGAAPTLAKIKDPSGRLPLHAAIASGKGYQQGVQGLIEAYPEAMEIPDPKTNLYPFMLAATAGEGSKNVSTIYELMRLGPELAKMALSEDMGLKPKAR